MLLRIKKFIDGKSKSSGGLNKTDVIKILDVNKITYNKQDRVPILRNIVKQNIEIFDKIYLDEIDENSSHDVFLFYSKYDWGSQHYKTSFVIDDIKFCCGEQYMMYMKAIVFNDDKSSKDILTTSDPVKMKKLGRKVKNFVCEIWDEKKEKIVFDANFAKFNQNDDLKTKLLGTGDRILAEASPRDIIWGIGYGKNNPKAKDPSLWRGKNLLGKILMKVRESLK